MVEMARNRPLSRQKGGGQTCRDGGASALDRRAIKGLEPERAVEAWLVVEQSGDGETNVA